MIDMFNIINYVYDYDVVWVFGVVWVVFDLDLGSFLGGSVGVVLVLSIILKFVVEKVIFFIEWNVFDLKVIMLINELVEIRFLC